MLKAVTSFTGEYAFLSNFDTAPFEWRGTTFPGGEYAFSYAKGFFALRDAERHFQNVLSAPSPAKAKYFGRAVRINVAEWDRRKVMYMREIVHAKFGQVSDYAGRLINTGAAMLVEGNDWGDTTWGRCKNKDGRWVGQNLLGALLMEERGYWLHTPFGS